MSTPHNIRVRKATDINSRYAIFELLVDEVAILDVGFSDDDRFEISFNQAIVGKILEYEMIEEWVAKAKEMALLDKR